MNPWHSIQVPISITFVLSLILLTVGWNNHDQLSQLRKTHQDLTIQADTLESGRTSTRKRSIDRTPDVLSSPVTEVTLRGINNATQDVDVTILKNNMTATSQPFGIKVMKKRTVKVVVWKIALAKPGGVGHLMIDKGHPGEGPDVVGPSGVSPLPGTDHRKRLMFSTQLTNLADRDVLLVKKEWDNIEKWLVQEEKIGRITP